MTFHSDTQCSKERRSYTREEEEAQHLLDLRTIREGEYQRVLGEACRRIQLLPASEVTHETIAQILNTLSSKAMESMLPEIAEQLDILADEVSP